MSKPEKPYPEFPLFPHANGQWAKKIRGKLYYFGLWAEADAALAAYLGDREDLLAGRQPRRVKSGRLTTQVLVNEFLNAKRLRMESTELSERSHRDYYTHGVRLLEMLGDVVIEDLRPQDFDTLRAKLAKGVNLVTLLHRVRITRMIMKFAYDANLVDKPVRTGPGFRPPSKKSLRALRQSKPAKMFSAEEIQLLLTTKNTTMKAMILLGANCAFGPSDISGMPRSAVNLDAGWITYPRPKTAVMRRCPLWPETIEAVRLAMSIRPAAKRPEFNGLTFLTRMGLPYVRSGPSGSSIDSLGQRFSELTASLGISGNLRGFYALRHGFETIGGESKDQIAVDYIMGHAPPSDDMASEYRERISDDRLIAVSNHVRQWIFNKKDSVK